MRSRNGNYTFSLKFLTITLISSLVLNASEFLISYRYVVKDAILYNETLDISKAMKKCSGTPFNTLVLLSDAHDTLKKTIAKNSEKFIDYIHKLGLHVKHNEKNINYKNSSTTILTLRTTCFKVDFNDNFVRMSPLK